MQALKYIYHFGVNRFQNSSLPLTRVQISINSIANTKFELNSIIREFEILMNFYTNKVDSITLGWNHTFFTLYTLISSSGSYILVIHRHLIEEQTQTQTFTFVILV